MPIAITCPGCSVTLAAPDTAVGKQLKCPKCGTVCPVPARPPQVTDEPKLAEVVEDEPPERAAVARPRKKSRDRDEPARSRGPLIGGVVLVLVLLVGGFAVYRFGFRASDNGGGGPVRAENWHERVSAQNVFKARFPTEPREDEWQTLRGLKVAAELYTSGQESFTEPSLTLFAGFVRFSDDASDAAIEAAQEFFGLSNAASLGLPPQTNRSKEVIGGREWVKYELTAQEDGRRSTGAVYWHRKGMLFHVMGYKCGNQDVPKGTVDAFCAAYEPLGGEPGDPDPNVLDLDNWQQYTAPDGTFCVSFPGASEEALPYGEFGADAEFRQHVTPVRAGKHTFLAGRVRFRAAPTVADLAPLIQYAEWTLFRKHQLRAEGRAPLGEFPWALEARVRSDRIVDPFAPPSGAVRWLVAGSTVYLAGVTQLERAPPEKALDKFFASYSVPGAKAGADPFKMPHDWIESRNPNAGFRAAVPRTFGQVADRVAPGGAIDGVTVESARAYAATEYDVRYEVLVIRFRPNTTDSERQKVTDALAQSGTDAGTTTATKVTWGGRAATEYTAPANQLSARAAHGPEVGFVARVVRSKPGRHLAPLFFDSFAFDK